MKQKSSKREAVSATQSAGLARGARRQLEATRAEEEKVSCFSVPQEFHDKGGLESGGGARGGCRVFLNPWMKCEHALCEKVALTSERKRVDPVVGVQTGRGREECEA